MIYRFLRWLSERLEEFEDLKLRCRHRRLCSYVCIFSMWAHRNDPPLQAETWTTSGSISYRFTVDLSSEK